MWLKLLKPISNTFNDFLINRLLNQNTTKGVKLALAGLVINYGLNEFQVNLIINLLSGSSITWLDIYLGVFNCGSIYLIIKGFKLIGSKIDKFSNTNSSSSKNSDKSDNNVSFSRINF